MFALKVTIISFRHCISDILIVLKGETSAFLKEQVLVNFVIPNSHKNIYHHFVLAAGLRNIEKHKFHNKTHVISASENHQLSLYVLK